MTYKATQSFAGGSVSDYKSNPNDEKYKYTSKVDEDILERQAFNNKFYEITENGVAKNSSGIQTNIEKLEYKTENGVSKIQTTYADGKVKKDFQFEAKTSTALKVGYPLFNEVNNADSGKNIDGQSYFENYPYMTWVNLGLQQRPKVDFALLKDVATSTVTINQKKIDYEYNTRLNLLAYNESGYDIMLKLSTNAMINYNTAIYNSDWTYRINDYKANGLNDANDPNNYASVVSREQLTGEEENKRQEEEELNVYVTYRIRVANQSEIYSGTVNQLVDYFDASYELVTKDIVQDISDDDGNIKSTIVAKAPYFTKNDIPQGTLFVAPMEFTDEYSKTIISGTQGTILQTGEYMDLYLTFKVDENNNRAVELGDKHNIVEITSYSTFDQGALSKSPNLVMGMIDRDSEPGNLSVINQVGTLEDDSDIAPTITIGFMGEDIREIRGIVWEDVRTKLLATGQIVGDGVRDAQTEKPINGVTVQLIELVTAKDGKQYEYIWQEMDTGEQASKYVDMLNGTVNDKNIGSVKGLTNLEVGDGEYVFKGYVPGDYIVRFIYGDTKTAQTGVVNVKSYNGQDYKSTAYLGGRDITEWYDLDNKDIINGSLSDARDNENRRLDVIKYSKTMKYSIARVLASQDVGTDNYNANLIDELVNNTYMYADTAKIKVEVEYDTQEMTGKESEEYIDKYKIRNIDFGIEERPTAKIELEKEIEAIKITLADGTVLVDTDAGIKKNVQPSSEIISIYMDEEVMQGANIQIKYKITVTNKSQIDYTGITSESVGTTYYSGKESLTDRLVTTSIDIVADYVDNSLVYRIDDNQDNGWQSMETRFESIAKMETDGYLDPNAKLAEEGINQILINEKLTGIQLAPYESKTLSLVLTKTISSSDETDDLSYTNIAEILQYTNLVGRRADPPGNYDPAEADTDITETIVILPPFGANKAITTYIAIAIAVLALIAGGVIVIKKKLSNK